MKKKKYIILAIGIVLVLIVGILGVSYASWRFTNVQGDFNTLGTKCFEVTLEDATSGITLPSAHPMSEEEGKNQEGYTFTVKNKCSTNAFYQVNLEELALEVKKLSNEYIKVSLNDSTGKNLNTYEEVTKTLDDAETSHKLTSGALGPAGSENDEATYTVKLWMDEDTPIVGDVMNATFKSKVSVVATYVEESDLTNEIVAETNSLSEYNTKSETIEVTVTGTNYKIIEVSEDGVNWEPLESPGTTVTIERTYTTEGTNYVYFRDEIGTVQRVELETTKLDQSAPNITASSSDTWASVNPITITLEDTKSGLAGYQITDASGSIQRTIPEPTEWISISGTTANVTYNASENKTYYIWSKDTLENTDYKIVTISKIDTIDPVIVSITEQENYASTSIITATVKDEESGIVGYKFTTEEKEPTEWVSVDNIISETEFTYEADVNGTIYLYIKDGGGHVVHESFEVTKVDSIAPSVSYTIANSTTGSNSWYKALTLEATAVDNESGVSSASYCITTSETCTPDTTATLTNDKYQVALGSNASSQKVCSIITDIKGNKSEVMCSSAYKVDTIDPNQTFAVASSTSGSNGWYKSLTVQVNLSDDHSKVASAKYCITTSSCTPDTSATITNNAFTVALGSNASAQKVCVQTTDTSGRTSAVSCSNAYSVDTTNPSQSFSIASSTSGSNGWYQALSIKATLTDDHSKVASATYCITTSSCTPGTTATISNNTIIVPLSSNASAQKVCVQTTDKSGRTSTASCSSAYSVDTTNPTAKISASASGSTITVSAANSSDDHSKIATYYYSKDGTNYYSSTNSTYNFTGLADGTYTLYVKVTDKSGRTSSVVNTTATVLNKNIKVNVLAGPGGSINGYTKVEKNGSATFSATPSSGYTTQGVNCTNGSGTTSGNTITVSSVTADSVCVVSFIKTVSTVSTSVMVQTGKQTNGSASLTCGDNLTFGIETDGEDVGSIQLAIYHPSGTLLTSWTDTTPNWWESKTINNITTGGNYKVTHKAASYGRTVSATSAVTVTQSYTLFQSWTTLPTCSTTGVAIFKCRSCSSTSSVTMPKIQCG